MYNHIKAQQSKKRVHISWDILYDTKGCIQKVKANYIYMVWTKNGAGARVIYNFHHGRHVVKIMVMEQALWIAAWVSAAMMTCHPGIFRFQDKNTLSTQYGFVYVNNHKKEEWIHDFNTFMPRQNGCLFPDDIFKCSFVNDYMYGIRVVFHWNLFVN